jgi:hypothetical protein
VGEYDVLINDDKVEMASLGNPRILAVANNTRVDYSAPKIGNTSHSSTLAAIIYFTFGRYDCYNARIPVQGTEHSLSIGSLAFEDYEIMDPSRGTCPSYSDPLEDVIAAINKSTSTRSYVRFTSVAAEVFIDLTICIVMVLLGAMAFRGNSLYSTNPANVTHLMDPGWPVHSTTLGTVVGDHNIYRTDFAFFIAAAVVEMVCVSPRVHSYSRPSC